MEYSEKTSLGGVGEGAFVLFLMTSKIVVYIDFLS